MAGDDTVVTDAAELDAAPTGKDFTTADYLVLAVLGLLLPAALLVWGWL